MQDLFWYFWPHSLLMFPAPLGILPCCQRSCGFCATLANTEISLMACPITGIAIRNLSKSRRLNMSVRVLMLHKTCTYIWCVLCCCGCIISLWLIHIHQPLSFRFASLAFGQSLDHGSTDFHFKGKPHEKNAVFLVVLCWSYYRLSIV